MRNVVDPVLMIQGRVKSHPSPPPPLRTSSKFGHTFANNGNPDETAPYEPSHQDFHLLLS